MQRFAALSFTLALTACAESDNPGLGIYEVVATQTSSCADEGLLAAPSEMLLRAHLRRIGDSMHWDDGRGLLIGPYDDSDASFVVEQSILSDMREVGDDDLPACKIWRFLTIDAALLGDSPHDLDTVEGDMSYTYEPAEGSVCDDLLSGPTPLARELPCTASFALNGKRQ